MSDDPTRNEAKHPSKGGLHDDCEDPLDCQIAVIEHALTMVFLTAGNRIENVSSVLSKLGLSEDWFRGVVNVMFSLKEEGGLHNSDGWGLELKQLIGWGLERQDQLNESVRAKLN